MVFAAFIELVSIEFHSPGCIHRVVMSSGDSLKGTHKHVNKFLVFTEKFSLKTF